MINERRTTSPMNPSSRIALNLRGPRRASLAFLVLLIAVLALPVGGAVTLSPSIASPMAVAAPVGVAHAVAPIPAAPAALTGSLGSQVAAHIDSMSPALSHGEPLRWLGEGRGYAAVAPAPASQGPIAGAGAGPGSSSSNFYLPGSDCSGWYAGQLFVPWISGSAIAQVGSSNQTLVAAGGTMNEIFNGTTASPCATASVNASQVNYTLLYGYGAVYRSSDGGQQWTQSPIAPNDTLWVQNSSQSDGAIPTGNEYVAGAPDGSAAVITGYAPQCAADVLGAACTGPHGPYGPWGFAVSVSNDNGTTWSNASQVSGVNGLYWVTMSSTCQSLGFNSGQFVNNIPENPWIVMNNSLIVAGWDVLHQEWSNTACGFQVNAVVQVVTSTDGGVTWSAPMNVTNPITDSASLALGPSGTNTVYLAAVDSMNFSATTESLFFSLQKSTNNGVTWSTESDLSTLPVHLTSGLATSPDQFGTVQRPVLAVDNWSTSPNEGNLYLVWQDNNTGSFQGFSTIAFSKSTDGGTTWTAPVFVTGQTTSFNYVEPTLTVGPTGTIWINYYAINQSAAAGGAYDLYGIASNDGGGTWTPQFRISDASSYPGTTPGTGSSVLDLGFYMGAAATSAGEVPIWSDCRNVQCNANEGATGFDVQHYTADVELVNLSATVASNSTPTALVTTDGTVTSEALPVELGWDWGSSHLVRVPETLPYNSTEVESFTGLSGLSTSTSVTTTVTVSQLAVGLVAHYSPTPATFIEGMIQPLVPSVALTLDGLPVPLTSNATAYLFTIVVAQNGQSHWLNVTAPNYQAIHKLVATNAAGVTYQNFTLLRLNGTISIKVAASEGFAPYLSAINNATISVDGTPVVLSDGAASVAVPFGEHNVTASLANFVSSESPTNPLTVVASQVKVVTFTFTGGWINGTVNVAVAGEVLKVDGAPFTVNAVGVFSAPVPGGFHNLTATAPTYNLSSINNIGVIPLDTHFVNVSLSNTGYISGVIQPAGALTAGLLVRITSGAKLFLPKLVSGSFNETGVPAGIWQVQTTATDYVGNYTNVTVTAGNGTALSISLTASTPVCVTNCVPPPNCTVTHNCSTTNNNTPASGLSTLDIALIAVAIIVVLAILVAVLMVRRRGGSPPESEYNQNPPDQPVYGDSSTSELPKLQSDGSMGPPPGQA
jgi:hypothetical protein